MACCLIWYGIIENFNKKKIYQTVNLYYSKKEALKYSNYIKRNKSIYDLCKRPSMLHMTMYILPNIYDDKTSQEEVVTSSMIMTKYIEYWISRQDSKQIFSIFKQQDNKKKIFIIDFFTDLSIYMFENKTLLIDKRKLDIFINAKIIKEKLSIEKNKHELDGFINEIYTGYFIEVDIDNEDSFKFVHKSIFEFFVSQKVIQLIQEKNFSHEIFAQDWGIEISDFVQDSITNKDKNNKYPTLINLRDSFLDKYLFIPITKFVSLDRGFFLLIIVYIIFIILSTTVFNSSSNINEVNSLTNGKDILYASLLAVIIAIFLNTIISFIRKRLKFIARAYYINFISGNNKTTNKQWQHFIDFYEYFEELSNIKIKNIKFYKIKIRNMLMDNIALNNIIFEKCSLRIKISNSSINKISFIQAKIQSLKLENVMLSNIIFDECIFRKSNKHDYQISTILFDIYNSHKKVLPFLFKNDIKIHRKTFFKKIKSIIILKGVTMDESSIKSFQKFIFKNNIRRKDIICDNLELKDKLFNKV